NDAGADPLDGPYSAHHVQRSRSSDPARADPDRATPADPGRASGPRRAAVRADRRESRLAAQARACGVKLVSDTFSRHTAFASPLRSRRTVGKRCLTRFSPVATLELR